MMDDRTSLVARAKLQIKGTRQLTLLSPWRRPTSGSPAVPKTRPTAYPTRKNITFAAP
jgi:hypothetical protein